MDHHSSASTQERNELALLASNEGVWDWYVGQTDIYYSERVLRFLGYSKEKAPNIFTHANDCFHEEDLPNFKEAYRQSITENDDNTFASDCRYKHPDGTWHWLRIRGVVVHKDDGTVTRMVGSIINISHRKNAELALEEERFRLKQLIENVPVNVYYKDTESRFVLANTSTIEKLGASSPEEVIGKTDHDFFDINHSNKTRSNELDIMNTRTPQLNEVHRETWVRVKGKEDTWAKSSKLPWIDKKGNICGTFGITSDITDLVRTERMLTNMAEELQKRNVVYEEELQLAREVQQALLPQDLDNHKLNYGEKTASFHCRYAPASDMAGDFYEMMPISDHSIGILICDVMGHGVRSSLVVSMLRGLMEKEHHSTASPDVFLKGVNEGLVSILNRAGVTMFATAAYCVIDLKENTLQYSCAGHLAPIIIKDKKAKQLTPEQTKPCPALGLIPTSNYQTSMISLDDIDRLLLFTDGIHEVEDKNENEWGIEGLIQKAELSSSDVLADSLDSLLSSAIQFSSNNSFDDDVCLVAFDITHSVSPS